MNKMDKTIISSIMLGSLIVLLISLIMPYNNVIFAIRMSALIILVVFILGTGCVLSKRFLAMLLSIVWVLFFTIVVSGLWNQKLYNDLNKQLSDEYLTYRSETQNFYEDRIQYLRSLGATYELPPYADKMDNLKPYEYIKLGYNIQAVELIKGAVDEVSKAIAIKNNEDISTTLTSLKEVRDLYDGRMSNLKFNCINYILEELGEDVNVNSFGERASTILNANEFKEATYIQEVYDMNRMDKNALFGYLAIIPLLFLTYIIYLLCEKWITREDKR